MNNIMIIKFSPLFMWSLYGKAKLIINNEHVKDIKRETVIEIEESKYSVQLQFVGKNITTDTLNIDKESNKKQQFICGIKYNNIRLIFKVLIYLSLFMLLSVFMKIINRTVSYEDYKKYLTSALIIFIAFVIDKIIDFIISKRPEKFLYFKKIK